MTQLTLDQAYSLLHEFTALEFDWDSYGADPISKQAIAITRQLLDVVSVLPFYIVPIPDGGILLQWQCGCYILEVEIGFDKTLGYILETYTDRGTQFQHAYNVSWEELLSQIEYVLSN
jgi:hypothetical protein